MKNTVIYSIIYGILSYIALLWFLGFGSGLLAIVIGGVLALLPVPVYIYFVLRTDPSPEPAKILIPCFVWGLSFSAVLALIFNNIAGGIMPEWAVASFFAPCIEEFFKGLSLLGVLLFARSYLNNIRDGVVYASMTGLGFAMAENAFYYVGAFLSGGLMEAIKTFGIRAIGGMYAHPVFTSLTAIGIVLATRQKNKWLQLVTGFGGFVLAVLMHMAWNSSSMLGDKGYWLMWAVLYLPVVIFITQYKFKEKG